MYYKYLKYLLLKCGGDPTQSQQIDLSSLIPNLFLNSFFHSINSSPEEQKIITYQLNIIAFNGKKEHINEKLIAYQQMYYIYTNPTSIIKQLQDMKNTTTKTLHDIKQTTTKTLHDIKQTTTKTLQDMKKSAKNILDGSLSPRKKIKNININGLSTSSIINYIKTKSKKIYDKFSKLMFDDEFTKLFDQTKQELETIIDFTYNICCSIPILSENAGTWSKTVIFILNKYINEINKFDNDDDDIYNKLPKECTHLNKETFNKLKEHAHLEHVLKNAMLGNNNEKLTEKIYAIIYCFTLSKYFKEKSSSISSIGFKGFKGNIGSVNYNEFGIILLQGIAELLAAGLRG